MNVCLYVCFYLIQIHISKPIRTKLCTHLPCGLEETVGYVWAHNIPPSPPFDLFRCEGLHDAAQKWLPAPRGIPQNVISVTLARVRVTSRTRHRGALHILTARVVLCGWCVENAKKITAHTRVNVETG